MPDQSALPTCGRCGRTFRSVAGLGAHQTWHCKRDRGQSHRVVGAQYAARDADLQRVEQARHGWAAVWRAREFLAGIAESAAGVVGHATNDSRTLLSPDTIAALGALRDAAREAVAALERLAEASPDA